MLYRIKGRAGKCGPSTISAIAGIHTHEAAGIIRQLFDRKTVNGTYMDELAAALIELGWKPEYALRHRNLSKRRHARRQATYDRIFADVPAQIRSVTIGRVLDVWPSGTWANRHEQPFHRLRRRFRGRFRRLVLPEARTLVPRQSRSRPGRPPAPRGSRPLRALALKASPSKPIAGTARPSRSHCHGSTAMPQIVTTTVFTIDELSNAARENARFWYRDQGIHDDWHDYVFDDFETICRIIGITLDTHPVRLYGGGTRQQSNIWFRGFWSQDNGACYEGRYSHARGGAKALRAHAPKDTELHRIVDALQQAQRRNIWQLHATFKRIGRYSHANSMEVDVERDSPTWQPIADDTEDVVIDALRDLAHWLYRELQDAYEAETSDEAVDETLTINEWTFTADGKRFG